MDGSLRAIGIVAGVAEELAAVLPDVPRDPVREGALKIERLATADGRTVYLAHGGIGKGAAASAAAWLAGRFPLNLLAVTGTAGNIGGLGQGAYRITRAFQADFGAKRAGQLERYTAGAWPIGPASLQGFEALELPSPLPTATLATSDLFIECAEHVADLRRTLGTDLVDMETGAVAQTAALLGLPWVAVKAVTDDADHVSATDFTANLVRAARDAAEGLEALLGLR